MVWKILIVDDDDAMRDAMLDSFSDPDFAVSTAKNGIDATLMIESEAFDAVITDVNMPKMNGLQFAANVKNSTLNSKIPLFLVSGNASDEVMEKALEFKVVSIVPKPYNEEAFIAMVREALEHRSNFTSHSPEIVAAFTRGVTEVLAFYFNEQPTTGDVKSHREPTLSSFSSAIVTFTGTGVGGFLAMSLNQAFLKATCDMLFPDARVEMKEGFAGDLAGEITNQIAGRVKSNLAKLSIDVAIGLPQVVLGIGHKIIHRTTSPVLRVDFTTRNLTVTADFGLIRSAKTASRTL